jgi:hypothetical protein
VGVAVVQSVLSAESLQPHRFRYWKDSPDPEFEPKMLAVVGLYMQPPQNAVVLSVDEKTSIQALDRTQPRLPMTQNIPLGGGGRAHNALQSRSLFRS